MAHDDYYLNNNGTMEVVRTGENTHRYFVQTSEGETGTYQSDYRLELTLEENTDGLVLFPSNGESWGRYGAVDAGGTATSEQGGPETVGQGDHYLTPESAGALLGLTLEVNNNGLTPEYGDMSSSNGSDPWQSSWVTENTTGHHAGHGHNGNRSGIDVDFRYFNADGNSFQSTNASANSSFSISNNQSFYDSATDWGFTRNYKGTANGYSTITNSASGHNDHGHIGRTNNNTNITVIRNKLIRKVSIRSSPGVQ